MFLVEKKNVGNVLINKIYYAPLSRLLRSQYVIRKSCHLTEILLALGSFNVI